jgi:RNA polymerase sigma factor (sigma-70 family)
MMYQPGDTLLMTVMSRFVTPSRTGFRWSRVTAMTDTQAGSASAASGDLWDAAAAHFAIWHEGDPRGLDDLVAVMTPVLWQVVRAYRVSPEVAEDVIQSTWLALVRHRNSIDDHQAVGGWLTTTARRAAWRAGSQTQRDVSVDPTDLEPYIPAERSAESRVVEGDERSRLWRVVATLDQRCQRLLRVVAFEQRPDYAALSNDLRMPVGSIGPTRGRCLTKLRAALADGGVL